MTIYQLLFNRLTLFIIHFSVSSVFSVAKNTHLLCGCKPLFVRVFKCRLNNELQSIKNERLCKTNPISERPKMVVTLAITMTNNNKQRTMNYSKQTQSNPTCSELVEPISKGTGWLRLLYVEKVRQFFERAARAFGVRPAEFFAKSYEERMVFIEKLRILRQI
jgi:hypothetical protein